MKTNKAFDMRSALRTTCVTFGAAVALWLIGRGALSTPPVDSWTQFQRWLGDRSTAEAAIAAVRSTAMVAACYLSIVGALAIVANMASIDRLDRVARSLVPRSLRPLIGLAVGAGVVTAAAGMTVPRDTSPTSIATVTLEAPTDATATMYFVTDTAAPTSITTTPIAPDSGSATSLAPTPAPTSALIPATLPAPAPTVDAAVAAPHSWTIAPGEHLWIVARETLADSWHRAPTDAEVTPYWHELIANNRGRLIDANNPDYVLAGQTFVLPTVPAAPAR